MTAQAGDPGAHTVVDAPAGENHLRVMPQHCRLVRKVVGIDPDAVPADETGGERDEVPLRVPAGQYVPGVDAHAREEHRELVHQGDVEVPLGVLDDLRRFGDPDGRGAVDAGRHHRLVHARDEVERVAVLGRHDLRDLREGVLPVAGVDALGE